MVDIDKIIPKVRRWADGSIMHDHVFENEPDEATVERFASMPLKKRRDIMRRMRRIIDDDDDEALVGFNEDALVDFEESDEPQGMKAYLTIEEDHILISARAEFDGIVGDVFLEVRPGETAFDWSYEKLLEHAPGWVVL